MRQLHTECRAFSLIEVMVATVILSVVVLITSTMFHQSSIAWDGGLRKAEGNMGARAVLGLMARELTEATADPTGVIDSAPPIPDGRRKSITFVNMSAEIVLPDGGKQRSLRKIKYEQVGEEIQRTVWDSGNGQYGQWGKSRTDVVADKVDALWFVSPQYASKGYLPPWVRIELAVKRTDDVSGVGAWSAGPDSIFHPEGEGDDLRSW